MALGVLVLISIVVLLPMSATHALEADPESVTVDASVVLNESKENAIKTLSTIEIDPPVLSVGGTALVTVTIRKEGGIPLENETVVFVGMSGSSGYSIGQTIDPTNSDGKTYGTVTSPTPGLAQLTAVVTTYEYDIPINDFDVVLFEPVAVPVMKAEPSFTKGYSNTVYWIGNALVYEYEVEVARDVGFSQGDLNCPWVSDTQFLFGSLLDGQIYYYRVRAKNKYGAVSDWSNIVYSIQDATPPWSSVDDVVVDGDSFDITARAVDTGSGVDRVRLYANRNGSEWEMVGYATEGSARILIADVISIYAVNGNGTYCFYTEAEDVVGNIEINSPGESGDFCIEVGKIAPPSGEEPGEISAPSLPVTQFLNTVKEYTGIVWKSISISSCKYCGDAQFRVWAPLAVVGWNVALLLLVCGIPLGIFPAVILLYLTTIRHIFSSGSKRVIQGVVYDSETEKVVPWAKLKLYSKRSHICSTVSSRSGEFSFDVGPGTYYITVERSGYIFPSRVTKYASNDNQTAVYRGELCKVLSISQTVLLRVPLDQEEDTDALFMFLLGIQGVPSVFIDILMFLSAMGIIILWLCFTMTGCIGYISAVLAGGALLLGTLAARKGLQLAR